MAVKYVRLRAHDHAEARQKAKEKYGDQWFVSSATGAGSRSPTGLVTFVVRLDRKEGEPFDAHRERIRKQTERMPQEMRGVMGDYR